MASKRKISAAEFVKDLRSGMTLAELMDKHALAPRELDAIFRQLKQSLASPSHLYGRSPSEPGGTGIEGIRYFRRHLVGLPVRVHDPADPGIEGQLRDISERGLGVQGIETKIGEVKTLAVWANEFFSINQFRLIAKCRWTTPTGDDRKCLSGFEIIRVSEGSTERLKRFIEACTRADQVSRIVASPDPLTLPAPKAAKSETVWICPFCQKPQDREHEECPQCGIIAKKYMQRLDTTKSEILSIMEKECSLPQVPSAYQKDLTATRTISISAKLWNELESLGGDPLEHLTNAISSYVLRHKVSRYGPRE